MRKTNWPKLGQFLAAEEAEGGVRAATRELGPHYVRKDTSASAALQENERAERFRVQGGGRPVMVNLTQAVERRRIEMSPLPIPVVLLVGLVALNVTSAVLALLAA
jgi:hypothetical protein